MSRVTGDRQRELRAEPEGAEPTEAGEATARAGAASQAGGMSSRAGNQAILTNELAANVASPGEPALPLGEPDRSEAADPIHAGEVAIASLLRWGVGAAALLLVLALTGSLLSGVPLGSRLLPFGQLLGGGHALPPVLAQIGLITLAVTPLARVALAAGVFARAGEKRQTWVAVGVLALLAVALLLGAVEG